MLHAVCQLAVKVKKIIIDKKWLKYPLIKR